MREILIIGVVCVAVTWLWYAIASRLIRGDETTPDELDLFLPTHVIHWIRERRKANLPTGFVDYLLDPVEPAEKTKLKPKRKNDEQPLSPDKQRLGRLINLLEEQNASLSSIEDRLVIQKEAEELAIKILREE